MQAFTRLTQRSPHDRGDRHLRIGHVGPGRGWRHVIVNEVGRALVVFDRSSACQDAVVEELVSRMRCQASGARRDVKAPGVGGGCRKCSVVDARCTRAQKNGAAAEPPGKAPQRSPPRHDSRSLLSRSLAGARRQQRQQTTG